MWKYLFYKFGQLIVHCVPRPWAYAFGRFVSDLQFRFSPRDRAAVLRNMRQILGKSPDVYKRSRAVFLNFGQYLVDFFLMYKVSSKFVEENVRIEHFEHLTQALEKGRGVIMLTAHIGNWEMGAAVLAQMGHPLTVIALPHKERVVNDLFNRQRQAHGVTVVPPNVGVRRCVEALRKGRLIALLGDRDFGTFGEPMMFLGRKTLIPKGAAFFSYKTGTPIIPVFLIPEGEGKYVLTLYPAIEPDVTRDQKDEVFSLMERSTLVIEEKIRQDPSQWMMFRDFGVDHEHLYSHTGV